ncbi:MAG: hypothetical protein IT244_11430 [Bacteroidia bacterium]|nr:hypothetical protein [Bacteroidia bacterium]
MSKIKLNTGDVLRTVKQRATDIMHYAIAYGKINGVFYVAENNVDTGVILVPLTEFVERYGSANISIHANYFNSQQIMNTQRRIVSMLNKGYNMFTFNCESFVNWVLYGKPTSAQVKKAGNIVLGTAAVFCLFAILSGGGQNNG